MRSIAFRSVDRCGQPVAARPAGALRARAILAHSPTGREAIASARSGHDRAARIAGVARDLLKAPALGAAGRGPHFLAEYKYGPTMKCKKREPGS